MLHVQTWKKKQTYSLQKGLSHLTVAQIYIADKTMQERKHCYHELLGIY
jgi:hypothetical protein